MGRPRRAFLLLVALVLVAGCARGGGGDDAGEDATTTAPADQTTGTGPDGAAAEAPVEETLRFGLVSPLTLDPAAASPANVSAMLALDLVHDTLTELDAEGAPQPRLADFVPNEDLTAWRFTVREGADFADGSPIEADDVVASLDRVRGKGGDSLAAIHLEDVQSVAALDPRTVEVVLARPSAVLPEVLSSPLYGIIDRDVVPGPFDAPVNPSGRYRVVAAAPERLVLERRAGEGPPRVELRSLGEPAAAHDAFTAGEVDWAPIPIDRLGGAGETGTDELVAFHAQVMLGVNPAVPPLDVPQVRQAVALAVDRAALTAATFGPAAQAANGIVPDGVPGASATCLGPCGADVDRARQLVAEAFPEGSPPPLGLLTDDTSTHESLARIIKEQLGAVGIDVAVQAADEATYGGLLGTGQQQLFLHSSLGVARTPVTHLLPWASDSPDNLSGYRNELVDLALQSALAEPDRPVRTARWQEIEGAILADVPVIPIAQLRTLVVVSPRVQGLVLHADGGVDVRAVRLGRG